jgi:hypothetical protein
MASSTVSFLMLLSLRTNRHALQAHRRGITVACASVPDLRRGSSTSWRVELTPKRFLAASLVNTGPRRDLSP